ncbi:D-methionine transport system ATP-binding protein [Keratinibaculum paraultunense]|uniref:D-methionine transport system ATP-binding protein n=1 Tax=Keratinibaculum paraultunense TaxID=1278232 RepID=A0A4R3KYU2_9FIRM|nr:methionine ABC transporter ATP-binding protein [Keratinibaculum paraultunense]QQY78872.1 methionine ABC transporter ATP-binding protein [Keratinibaculum paraultunense]TCS90484.1 D-methionine transport system ATP-binding protein [Keratinibaculum paraultunense]
MIEIKNLSKKFTTGNNEIWAIKDVNLHIEKGEIFGIIGLSGAGKSTLIRCLNRLEEPTNGQIIIDGVDITNLNKSKLRNIRKKIGMIFQHFNLLSQKTVFQNIAFPLELEKQDKQIIKTKVNKLLDFVELTDKKDAYPSELSGGQKQRVAIARALVNNPKILLSDEATSALDPQTTDSILKLLKRIRDEFGLTIVLITHQMEVVKDICDKVAVMENGKIIETNTAIELFRNPKTKTAKSFINSLHSNIEDELIYKENFDGKIIRLSFLGESAKKPIVSKMIKQFDIEANILSGNINNLVSTSVGHLILELSGNDNEIQKAINFLNEQNVNVEVI